MNPGSNNVCRGKVSCGRALPQGDFALDGKGGFRNQCRDCRNLAVNNWDKDSRQSRCDSFRLWKYGLTKQELDAWLSVPVCQVPGCNYVFRSDSDQQFDHDHESGHLRGVVCPFHNTSMRSKAKAGRDTIDDLLAMVAYLKRDLERQCEQG